MFLKTVFDWSEVWAPLIPLTIGLTKKNKPGFIYPLLVYFGVAVVLNCACDMIWKQRLLGLTLTTANNNPVYNIHCILRFFLLNSFFFGMKQPLAKAFKKMLPFIFLLFAFIDLLFWEDPFKLSIANQLHMVEAGLLLLSCLLFYFFILRNEEEYFSKIPSFWMVTGLAIFVAVSFPIYLYYNRLIRGDFLFAVDIWKVQKAAFLFFCLLAGNGLKLIKSNNIVHG